MFLRAIRNIFALFPHLSQQGAVEHERRREKPKLLDVMEARFLSEEARRRNVALTALLKNNSTMPEDEPLREGVEKKVNALMAPYYDHQEILDEVTEKLTDASYHDAAVRRWFG